ncbi:MAG: OsmC family protein [Phycisphaerae bacterium]
MPDFAVHLEWEEAKRGRLAARENPPLSVATPPAFGGPEGVWSAEELLVASVGGGLMSTLLYFTDRFDVPLEAYASTSRGRVEKTPSGLRFTSMEVAIQVTVPDEEMRQRAADLQLKEKLEKYCPVSTALNCPVRITLDLNAGAGRSVEG